MIADVAHLLHTPLGELLELPVDELLQWHQECRRIAERKGTQQ